MDFKNLWVAEYSTEQGQFHIDSLGVILDTNANNILSNCQNDYQIFGIYETSEQANAACDAMERALKKEKNNE